MSVEGLLRWGYRHDGKVKESGGYNHTIMWEWYRQIYNYALQGASWCGASDCVSLTWGGGWEPPANWTGVYWIEQWGRDHGRYHDGTKGIEIGDALILIAHGQHTGIARAKPKAGFVRTFEGNTSSGLVGSQDDGDGYYKRLRPAYQVVGYVKLHDLIAKAETPKNQPDFNVHPLPINVDGSRGSQTIAQIQRAINDVVDGYWSKQTKRRLKAHLNKVLNLKGKDKLSTDTDFFGPKAIKALQKHVGVRQTGVWTKATTKAVQRKLNAKKF